MINEGNFLFPWIQLHWQLVHLAPDITVHHPTDCHLAGISALSDVWPPPVSVECMWSVCG